jgi:hypothetical protein
LNSLSKNKPAKSINIKPDANDPLKEFTEVNNQNTEKGFQVNRKNGMSESEIEVKNKSNS